MIKIKEHQSQQPIFDLKHIISRKKIEFTNSSLSYNTIKDRGRLKKKVAKRSSCHNFSTDNRENQSGQFSTKLLDHIFTQIKHNYKSCQKSKQEGSIIHSVIQKKVQITSSDVKELNRQNNLKIKSINDQIKPKTQKSCRNKTCSTPFQNKKLMNLRKGKSYTLYTQQIEPQVTEHANEAKILPWEFYNNHIIDLPGTPHQIDDQTIEQQYLKSHHLRPKQQKKFAGYNTLAFAIPQQKKPCYKKYSSVDVTQPEKEKPIKSSTHYNQVFSTNSVKERTYWPVHCRGIKNINRTLTQMKMDIEQIQLQKPNQNVKNINLQGLFYCVIPKNNLARKNRTSRPNKLSNSYRRITQQARINCFLVGRKI